LNVFGEKQSSPFVVDQTISFGAPHLGNYQLASLLDDKHHLRVTNKFDAVPFLINVAGELNPLDTVIKTKGYRHSGQEAFFDSIEVDALIEPVKDDEGKLMVPIESVVPLKRCKDSSSTCCARDKDNLNRLKPETLLNAFRAISKDVLVNLKTHCYYSPSNS